MREIEVKLKIEDFSAVRERLIRAGGQAEGGELFEDNRVYDTPRKALKTAHQVLRLRTIGGVATLTLKTLPKDAPADGRYKQRLEFESRVEDPNQIREILEGLGFIESWRYQKYRQAFRLGEVKILLDRTPIGSFLEIEGSPEGIEGAAQVLGFGPSAFITKTYRDLHEEAVGNPEPGPMIFSEGTPP